VPFLFSVFAPESIYHQIGVLLSPMMY